METRSTLPCHLLREGCCPASLSPRVPSSSYNTRAKTDHQLRGKFIAIQFYLKKKETCQINNLTLHLKLLEKEEPKNPKVSRRKEIIKIRSEINEKEMKEMIAKINKTKSWFFKKINKIDKPLARLIKNKGRRLKSIELEMKKGK